MCMFQGSSPAKFKKRKCCSALLDQSKITGTIFLQIFKQAQARENIWMH